MVYDGREDRLFTLENYQHLPGRRITSFLPVNISNKFRADEIDIICGVPNGVAPLGIINACVQKTDVSTYSELPEKLDMLEALNMQKDGRANQPIAGDITIETLERLFLETLDTRPFMAGPPRPPGWK